MSEKIGPTGDFPRGKACSNDEGGLNIKFGSGIGLNGESLVMMSFGKEVGWIGLEVDRIDGFCEMLQRAKNRALEIAKKS